MNLPDTTYRILELLVSPEHIFAILLEIQKDIAEFDFEHDDLLSLYWTVQFRDDLPYMGDLPDGIESYRWNQKPIINSIIDILAKNKGEILNRRLEELLKKEFPFINSLILEEIFMKLETQDIINVFRVSKNKKMIVYNKNNKKIREEVLKDMF